MAELMVSKIENNRELTLALKIRRLVFIDEQDVPEAEESDHFDAVPAVVKDCIHVLAWLDSEPIATGRLLIDEPPSELAHIGRVAVLAEHRGTGVGRALMTALHDEARSLGRRCHLTSQTSTSVISPELSAKFSVETPTRLSIVTNRFDNGTFAPNLRNWPCSKPSLRPPARING